MRIPVQVRCAWAVTVSLMTSTALSAKAQTSPKLRVIGTSVRDDRDTQESSLDITLKVQSDAFARAHDIRFVLKTAVDETGRNLLKEDAANDIRDAGFRSFEQSGHNSTDVELSLKSPSRKAMAVKQIAGDLEIYSLSNDPASVVTLNNFYQHTGKPIVSPLLKSEGLEITMWTKEQYDKTAASKGISASLSHDLSDVLGTVFGGSRDKTNAVLIHAKDPHVRLVDAVFEDAHGKPIKSNGLGTTGTTQDEHYTYYFDKKLPSGARVKLYVATPKSITKLPFEVKNLPLP